MTGIIDADAAKAVLLASTVEAPPAEPKKFALMDVDLGTIEVPADWSLDTFKVEKENEFRDFNPDLTDANFPSPKWAAGKRYRVRAFRQIAPGTTSSSQRLTFLESQGASYLGAQGAAPVYKEKRLLLHKGEWYSSFTEGDLTRARDGLLGRVPGVSAFLDGGFRFRLGSLGDPWYQNGAFLGFWELPSDA